MILTQIVTRSDKLSVAKKFLELYLTINDTKYNDRLLTVLAYYCLYGINPETDAKIREEYFHHQEYVWARHSIYDVRTQLRKLKLMYKDENAMIDRLTENLRKTFSTDDIGYAIQFIAADENNKRSQSSDS